MPTHKQVQDNQEKLANLKPKEKPDFPKAISKKFPYKLGLEEHEIEIYFALDYVNGKEKGVYKRTTRTAIKVPNELVLSFEEAKALG